MKRSPRRLRTVNEKVHDLLGGLGRFLRRLLGRKLEQLHATAAINREEIIATAHVKLDYASRLSDRENAALAADSAVQDAKRRMVDAGAKVNDLRSHFARSVKRNNQFVASGVYFYHVESASGKAKIGRFTVVNFAQ